MARIIAGRAKTLTAKRTGSVANARLESGHVTAADLGDAEQQIALLQQLEATAGRALRTRPGHTKARRIARRTLAEQGAYLRGANALFGIVSEVVKTIGGASPVTR